MVLWRGRTQRRHLRWLEWRERPSLVVQPFHWAVVRLPARVIEYRTRYDGAGLIVSSEPAAVLRLKAALRAVEDAQ